MGRGAGRRRVRETDAIGVRETDAAGAALFAGPREATGRWGCCTVRRRHIRRVWQANRVSGERDLTTLLASLSPELVVADGAPRPFVFATTERVPEALEPVAVVREAEGVTVVVDRSTADRHQLDHDFVAAMITLRVHSALDAVGLTAAVAGHLARAGISCNVVAGYHHDHLFVPLDRGHEAVELLRGLRGTATAP